MQKRQVRSCVGALETGAAPDLDAIVLQTGERIEFATWGPYMVYSAVIHAVTGGSQVFCCGSSVVRDLFGLGRPLPFGLKPTSGEGVAMTAKDRAAAQLRHGAADPAATRDRQDSRKKQRYAKEAGMF
eukprot:gnl/Ergobibamus_cyprinoides/437.p1 GENE.gnl/Ergobibamus_cyprinoides/437~~gnl/Ergobibamus_cyprinoides/437.p1  ORF type:complete len:128 (+),score=39.46 gnl/Ergobibamus_cyprinoides/437:196-579(+)